MESDQASFWLYFLPGDPGRLVCLSEPLSFICKKKIKITPTSLDYMHLERWHL